MTPQADMLEQLFAGKVIGVSSSNVSWIQYDKANERLFVGYQNLGIYAYYPVSSQEAAHLLFAPSKGKWIWDHIRVRGSKTDHQKVYGKVT